LTRTGAVVGPLGYLAPEAVRHKKAAGLDDRVDVFSLGCVLYQCLSGAAAFGGTSRLAVHLKLLLCQPVPRGMPAHVPPALTALVNRAMSRRPADRPTAAAMATQLGRIAAQLTGDPCGRVVVRASAPSELMFATTSTAGSDSSSDAFGLAEGSPLAVVVVLDPSGEADKVLETDPDLGNPSTATDSHEQMSAIANIAAAHNGHLAPVADGVAVLFGIDPVDPVDVARVDDCAAALRAALPGSRVASAIASKPSEIAAAIEACTGAVLAPAAG
jgi:eukaryotic-like serine/threonine-protein kinase